MNQQNRVSSLQQRIITGAVLAAVVVVVGLAAATSCETRWWVVSCAFLVSAFCAWEFALFSTKEKQNVAQALSYFIIVVAPHITLLLVLAVVNTCDDFVARTYGYTVGISAVVASFVAALLYMAWTGRQSLARASDSAQELFIAVLLIGMGGAALMCLSIWPRAHVILLWLITVVCSNDIAAYAVGKKVGGPKLALAISPNKTVSGSLGGIITGLLVGIGLAILTGFPVVGVKAVGMSLTVVLAAQAGDLAKSFLKRIHGVKDSGTLLPGHGGVLDRVDGILCASPVVYAWLALS